MFRITIIFFLLFQSLTMTAQDKPTLIYIGDPMCSWCYGFSPELTIALDELGEKVEVETVMGGLRPYNTQTMMDLADFLTGHWREVHERSNQPFNYDVLKTSQVYDTEPPSRAVVVMRELAPAHELAFFKDIQTAFYFGNKNMGNVETYLELAKKYKVNSTKFKTLFESAKMKNAVRADFEKAAAMGVRGFPTVVLKKGEEYILISNGYLAGERVAKMVEANL
jgi:putative protein-disulfide isomerase